MDFFRQKLSTFILFLMTLFIVLDIIGYFLLRDNLRNLDQQAEEVLIYKVQKEMDFLVNKLLYIYETKKALMLQKHKMAYDYLKEHDYDENLDDLKLLLNRNEVGTPFNISITDTDYVIENTTTPHEYGFDLSFAKSLFDTHHENGVVGVSVPVFEVATKEFYSFTDQYLQAENERRILQVSFHYETLDTEIENIYKLIQSHQNVHYIRAYILAKDGQVSDFVLDPKFRDNQGTKDIQSSFQRKAYSAKILENLQDKARDEDSFYEGDVLFKELSVSQQSPMSDDARLIYSVVFDKSAYQEAQMRLNITMYLIALFGVIAIFIISKLKKKEVMLHDQELFLKHSIHEIRTPLSVISLNNEMREREFGRDDYGQQIDSAIKVLDISYNDLSYLILKDSYEYELEFISLESVVQERFRYFESISASQGKNMYCFSNNNCQVYMSRVELVRLIDNNLSNAVKYAHIGSDIKVKVEDNLFYVQTKSNVIKNVKRVFEAYYRENKIKGGYGLGLSIISDIAKKYEIGIDVNSSKEETVFEYTFKCKRKGE